MEEKRKHERSKLKSKIIVKSLDGHTPDEVEIDILDVSKSGVGFTSSEKLEICAIYEGYLTIWTKEVIHSFLEIVRIEKLDDGRFSYGAIFIGMPEIEAQRIEAYQTIEKFQ